MTNISKWWKKAKANGYFDEYLFAGDYLERIKESLHIKNFNYIWKFHLFERSNNSPREIARRIKHLFAKYGIYSKPDPFTKIYDCSAYSLGPIGAVYKAKGDYLLYFTEDCMIENKESWIDEAIVALKSDTKFYCARPYDDDLDRGWFDTWNCVNDDFKEGYLFTDRMWLASLDTLRNTDYEAEDHAEIYLPRGRNDFEAKAYNHMVTNGMTLLVSRKTQYIHEWSEYTNGVKAANRDEG